MSCTLHCFRVGRHVLTHDRTTYYLLVFLCELCFLFCKEFKYFCIFYTHRTDCRVSYSLISSDLTRMTDSERDQIDQDAQIFMRTCSEAIKQLRHEGVSLFHRVCCALACIFSPAGRTVQLGICFSWLWKQSLFCMNYIWNNPFLIIASAEKLVTSAQIKEHRGAVLDLIEMYLKSKFTQLIWILTAHDLQIALCGLLWMHLHTCCT